MDEMEVKRWARKLYDERINSNLNAVDAAGQWGEMELVPLICDEILKKIEIKKSDKVLEIGCGSGVLGSYLRERCAEYYGIDISFGMLQKFQDEYNQEKWFNLVQGITDSLPFPNNTFSKILMNSVTMYLHKDEQLEKTLAEMERVSVDNGLIFIGENVVPSRVYWEYSWFQNLNRLFQIFAKPYIRLRLFLASKNPSMAGKWIFSHRAVSPNYVKNYFDGKGKMTVSDAAAMTIRKTIKGKKWKGNRRMDFVIKLRT